MSLSTRLSVGMLVMGVCTTTSAVWDMTIEELIASMDAHVIVCSEIDPDFSRKVQSGMEGAFTDEQRQDIPCIRKTDIYKKAFKQELGWLMSLNSEEKRSACQHAL